MQPAVGVPNGLRCICISAYLHIRISASAYAEGPLLCVEGMCRHHSDVQCSDHGQPRLQPASLWRPVARCSSLYALPHAAATLQSPEFYTWIRKTYMWHQLGQAVFFFLWGGIPFLVWCGQGSKGWGLPWGGHCQWAGLLPADRNDAAHSAGGSSCHLALC